MEQSFHDSVGVRDLVAFEDIPGHPERGQEVFDELYGEMRYPLQDYIHVVALDSDGLIQREPECFAGGVQCNWRSTNGAIPPRNKNWFAMVRMPHTITNTPVCVVGELAEKKDLQILRWTRKVAMDEIDREDEQEYQLRLAEESEDPVGLGLMAKSLDREPGSPSSAADDRSQASVYEDRDFCEGSGQIRERNREKESTWSYDD